jgi:hypothetical protein
VLIGNGGSSAVDASMKQPARKTPSRQSSKAIEEHVVVADDVIRKLAYDLWERAGCPHGREEEFWLTARQQLFDAVTPPGFINKKPKTPAAKKVAPTKAAKPRSKKA